MADRTCYSPKWAPERRRKRSKRVQRPEESSDFWKRGKMNWGRTRCWGQRSEWADWWEATERRRELGTTAGHNQENSITDARPSAVDLATASHVGPIKWQTLSFFFIPFFFNRRKLHLLNYKRSSVTFFPLSLRFRSVCGSSPCSLAPLAEGQMTISNESEDRPPGGAVCWNDCQGISLLMFLIVLLFFINCLAPWQSPNESRRSAHKERLQEPRRDDIIEGEIRRVCCERRRRWSGWLELEAGWGHVTRGRRLMTGWPLWERKNQLWIIFQYLWFVFYFRYSYIKCYSQWHSLKFYIYIYIWTMI